MSETIYESDFTKYLPQPLTHDPKMIALAKAAANELLEVSGAVEKVLIYSRIEIGRASCRERVFRAV